MQRKSNKNKKYSKELKLQAILDYLNGGGKPAGHLQKIRNN